jgi:ElaB/YqjD/DUF883 family membrane-anchored ribosome-binding protein
MTDTSAADVQALRADIDKLRADFASLGETLKDAVRHRKDDAVDQVGKSIALALQTAKNGGKEVTQTLQEKPIASALTAFGIGVMLGLVFNSRTKQ